MVQSVICSVVEKHGRQIRFLTLSNELVETRSKSYFGGTVLKFRSGKDIYVICRLGGPYGEKL